MRAPIIAVSSSNQQGETNHDFINETIKTLSTASAYSGPCQRNAANGELLPAPGLFADDEVQAHLEEELVERTIEQFRST